MNSITAEEVFRALFDSMEANPDDANLLNNPREARPRFHWRPLQYSLLAPAPGRQNLVNRLFVQQMPAPFFDSPTVLPSFARIETGSTPIFQQAGLSATRLVNAELFKRCLQAIAGQDQTLGTLDDLPFRSFAQRSISDTLLRSGVDWASLTDRTRPYMHDKDAISAGPAGLETAARRRLFDGLSAGPADQVGSPNEKVDNTDATLDVADAAAVDPTSIGLDTVVSTGATIAPPMRVNAVYDRNRLLAKIAGNVTTRSQVFAGFATIGWFRIVPGSENDDVPMLDVEVGLANGSNVRHRAFFIVDRSLAPGYTGPQAIDDLTAEPVIRQFKIIE